MRCVKNLLSIAESGAKVAKIEKPQNIRVKFSGIFSFSGYSSYLCPPETARWGGRFNLLSCFSVAPECKFKRLLNYGNNQNCRRETR